MRLVKFKILFITLNLLTLFACTVRKPTGIDGTVILKIAVIDTSGFFNGNKFNPVAEAKISIIYKNYPGMLEYYTDENGMAEINNLKVGHCYITATKKFVSLMLSGSIELDIFASNREYCDTIRVDVVKLSGIVINEIYYSGTTHYYADQFIELYNNSDSVQYLDGIIVSRLYGEQFFPEQYVMSSRHYQFPGTGMEYPIMPDSFVVIAQDAIDHVTVGGARNSIDLSNADWEFFDQLGPDTDNPDVPNLINIAVVSNRNDFTLNLKSDEVCLIKVIDPHDVIDYEYEGSSYKLFPVLDVIDGVEYAADYSYHINLKALDYRIDAGLAGYQITKAYTGRSIERHNPATGEPGYDTNNSTFDFVTIKYPTPGYQHAPDLVIPRNEPF